MPLPDRLPEVDKTWSTLVTNTNYIEGLLCLEYSLRRVKSRYPLLVLYTEGFPKEGHEILDKRHIYKKRVSYLLPTTHKDYSNDSRFYDCWSKLQPFSLTQFSRVGQLDCDMVITQNMDELMDIPLDTETAIFAASHACVCNPHQKNHYPNDWIPENCAYTIYNSGPDHWRGPDTTAGLSMCNGGLQIVVPSSENHQKIIDALEDSEIIANCDFADQSLLSTVFKDKWVPLSYKYNALRTLRGVHSHIWDDEEVKNIHFIMTPKPWETRANDEYDTFMVWHAINDERLQIESESA